MLFAIAKAQKQSKYPSKEEQRKCEDFPGGLVVKNPPVNAGDADSIPGPGESHMLQGS